MKNTLKLIGTLSRWLCAIAFVAVIGFSFAACPAPGAGIGGAVGGTTGGGGAGGGIIGGGGVEVTSATYTGEANGVRYTLEITPASSRAAYSPKSGDNYTLTADGKTSSGKVSSFNGITFSLIPSNSSITFTVTITGGDMTIITGTITWSDSTADGAPGAMTQPTFTSISDFLAWLSGLPANTAATPYTIKLNIGNLGGAASTNGSVGNALYNNWKFVNLDLSGSTITAIPDNAFEYCYLIGINIPNSVTSIGDWAFARTRLTSVTIPNSVTSIGGAAFYNCTYLTSALIGSGVTNINFVFGKHPYYPLIDVPYPYGAFEGCTSLTSVNIPNSVTSIGAYAFGGCKSLTSVNIPLNVTSIEDRAFSGTGLTSVNIPNSVKSIGDSAFSHCHSLASVIIPNSVTNIGGFAFCSTNLTSVYIPASVTSIGDWAFMYSPDGSDFSMPLNTINVDTANTAYSSDNGVLYNKAKTSLLCYPVGKTGAYTIPNGVTRIEKDAFVNCNGITSLYIPASVTYIARNAISTTCNNLVSVTLAGASTYFEITGGTRDGSDLPEKYLEGGIGTYTRPKFGYIWTKLP